jgi:hypothetical protein
MYPQVPHADGKFLKSILALPQNCRPHSIMFPLSEQGTYLWMYPGSHKVAEFMAEQHE